MENLGKKTYFIFILIFTSTFGLCQTREIRIQFIGNCGLFMTDGKLNFYSDFPYKSGAYGYMKFDKSKIDSLKDNSIFLFTHRHADHFSRKLVKKLNGKVYGPWNVNELENLSDSLPDFSVKSYRTKHRFCFKHYSYLITWHGKKIYISGDTESPNTIAKVKDMDWAFVPPWILIDAQNKKIKIDSKMFAVYHLYPKEKFDVKKPERIILMDKQNEIITVPY